MLKDCMPEIAKPDDPSNTIQVMMADLGDIAGKFRYASQLRQLESQFGIELEQARRSIASLLVQCELLAEQMEWPLDELVMDGHKRFHERMNKLKDGIL